MSLQERFEATPLGRALISALLVITLVSVVVTNHPQSHARRQVLRAAGPYLHATGLDQAWALFAPEPRRASIALEARIEYADGSTGTWRAPVGDDLIGGYWDYHWQKWQEWVLDDDYRPLWRPAAEFVAREEARPGRRPVRVTLVRRTQVNNPPGRGPDRQPLVARPYYSLQVTDAMLARRPR